MDQKTIISALSSAGQWIKHLLDILTNLFPFLLAIP